MRDLMEIRQDIDEIDQQLVSLFEKRMGCSAEVAEYKRGTGKAIYDPVREKEKIATLTKNQTDHFMSKATEELFLQLMSISRRYQYGILSQEDQYVQELFEEVDEL